MYTTYRVAYALQVGDHFFADVDVFYPILAIEDFDNGWRKVVFKEHGDEELQQMIFHQNDQVPIVLYKEPYAPPVVWHGSGDVSIRRL